MTERQEIIDLGGLRAVAVGDPDAARVVMTLAHGLQMEPGDLSPFAHSLGVPAWFLFPEAPLDAEPRGRAWWSVDTAARAQAIAQGPRDFVAQHPSGLATARARLLAFLEAAKAAAGTRPLVIGGFSQGGMLTCDVLLRSELTVAALVLLSASRIAFDEWQPLTPASDVCALPYLQ